MEPELLLPEWNERIAELLNARRRPIAVVRSAGGLYRMRYINIGRSQPT